MKVYSKTLLMISCVICLTQQRMNFFVNGDFEQYTIADGKVMQVRNDPNWYNWGFPGTPIEVQRNFYSKKTTYVEIFSKSNYNLCQNFTNLSSETIYGL